MHHTSYPSKVTQNDELDTAEPRWLVPRRVVFVECVYHLTHLMESIDKKERFFLVRVAEGLNNILLISSWSYMH